MTENWLISNLVIIDTMTLRATTANQKVVYFLIITNLKCLQMPYISFSWIFRIFNMENSFGIRELKKNAIPFFSELCRCNSMVLALIQKGENLFPLALQFHFIEREQSPIWTRDEHCIECTCSSSVPPLAKNICNVPFCSMYRSRSIRMNVDLS